MSSLRSESGQVAPIVAVTLLGLMAVAGLVVDGGIMFSVRRDLQALADGAARAGAMQIDETVLRNSGGGTVQLDAEAATASVDRYLGASGFSGRSEVISDTGSVTVRLWEEKGTVLVRILGIDSFEAASSATARPRTGG